MFGISLYMNVALFHNLFVTERQHTERECVAAYHERNVFIVMVLYFCMPWVLNNMEVKNEDITSPLMFDPNSIWLVSE